MSEEIIFLINIIHFFFCFFFCILVSIATNKHEQCAKRHMAKVLSNYLQWFGCKCHFSILPIISLWKLQVAKAIKLKA